MSAVNDKDTYWPTKPDLRKVPANAVPYGDAICTRGNSVWAAYVEGVIVCLAATAAECRRKYLQVRREHDMKRMGNWKGE